MTGVVLDASAILAWAQQEAGHPVVTAHLRGTAAVAVSAVNWSEVVAKLADAGSPSVTVRRALAAAGVELVPFDADHAERAGAFGTATRSAGLSLGDRACLALAAAAGATAVTADRGWAAVSPRVGVDVEVIGHPQA